MKALRILLYILLVFVAILFILSLTGAKSYEVKRSTVVQATPAEVWPYVNTLEKMQSWSPWRRMDSTIVATYSGEPGKVGSGFAWESKQMGKGQQTILAVDPNKRVDMDLKIISPMGEMNSLTYVEFADTTGGTKVTWGISGKNGFLSRVMANFMSFDALMGKDFENGLMYLKEEMAKSPMGANAQPGISQISYAGGKYLAVRNTIMMSEMQGFFEKNFGITMGALVAAGVKPTTAPTGLYFVWDEAAGKADMAAGVGFAGDLAKIPDGASVIEIPAGKAVQMNYYGGYSGLGNAHGEIDAYLKSNNLMQGEPVIEEYVTDPGMSPDSTKWLTRIIYPVK